MVVVWQQLSRCHNWECIGIEHNAITGGVVLRSLLPAGKPSAAEWRKRNPDYAIAVSVEPESSEYPRSRKPNELACRYDLDAIIAVYEEVTK